MNLLISPTLFSISDGKQLHTNSLLSPRMEYDDWTPLGHGDPLKNDPTYDYVPPMLDKVKYWMTDGDNAKKHVSTATPNANDILLLGVSSLKKSTSKPNKKYSTEKQNLLNPAFTHNQKNSPAKTAYNAYEKLSNTNIQQNNDGLVNLKGSLSATGNFLQETSQMSSEKRTDPLETLLQFVSGKWNMPFSTGATKPMAPAQQTPFQQQQIQQQQQYDHHHHQQQLQHQQHILKQQELRQQYEQQLVKVPDIMLIPPVDSTSSNTWFLTEPTDNQLFTRAQNISNFKPADNVTDVYDLVTQNHFVTPASYDVQTSLKLQDVITQTNYPLVYQSNISAYTPISSITPTTVKAQEIIQTSYRPQETPTRFNTATSQSHGPFITPIGLKIHNIPTPTILKQNEIPATHTKHQTSVTPVSSLPSALSSGTPINFKQNTLFVTPLIYKTNYVTDPTKLSHTSWITPSAPSIFSVPFKLTTPANQFFIKHNTPASPNLKLQNHPNFSHWKLAQNQVFHNNPKFTPNPQQTFKHPDLFPVTPTRPNNVQTTTVMSTTVAPATIVFCNQTSTNVSSDVNKVTEKYSPSNKTLPVLKQSFPTMNLIIQGHSKVKKYGAAKVDKLSGITIQENNKENNVRKSRELHRTFESIQQRRSRKKRKIRDKSLATDRQFEEIDELIPVDDDDIEEVLQDILRQQGQASGFGDSQDNTLKVIDETAFR